MAKKREKDESLPVSVRKAIIEQGLIRKGDLVLVGVSGGADSLCLLHVLHGLSRNMGFTVAAVHVNHMLRGAESDMDEEFVRNICCDWELTSASANVMSKPWRQEKASRLKRRQGKPGMEHLIYA